MFVCESILLHFLVTCTLHSASTRFVLSGIFVFRLFENVSSIANVLAFHLNYCTSFLHSALFAGTWAFRDSFKWDSIIITNDMRFRVLPNYPSNNYKFWWLCRYRKKRTLPTKTEYSWKRYYFSIIYLGLIGLKLQDFKVV